jgi:hypothetical protein
VHGSAHGRLQLEARKLLSSAETDILAAPPPGEPPEVGGGALGQRPAGSVGGMHPSSSAYGLRCFALLSVRFGSGVKQNSGEKLQNRRQRIMIGKLS